MNEDVNAMIREQLRPSMEIMKWRQDTWNEPITEWPPGWVVVENTDEDADE